MSNPIFGGFTNRPQQSQQPSQNQSNNLMDIFNQLKNSPNPNKAAQDMLANNPTFAGVVDYINQNGGNAQAAFYNMAREKGQNPDLIVNNLKRMFPT